MSRPAVDIVIPFAGSAGELERLIERLGRINLRAGDRLIVADNRPAGAASVTAPDWGPELVAVRDIRSSYHARNRAAARGDAEWLLFLDADVEWSAELIEAYFNPRPGDDTAVLAGAIRDAPLSIADRSTLAERYAVTKRIMSSDRTLAAEGRLPYAQTANVLIRRRAFEASSGFTAQIRSGGDADLAFRLAAAGWKLEVRPAAVAMHRNRRTLRAVLAQKAKHGAGAAWLERRHPGSFPRRSVPGLALWSARELVKAVRIRGQGGPGVGRLDSAALIDVLGVWVFELGRLGPNSARGAAPVRGLALRRRVCRARARSSVGGS